MKDILYLYAKKNLHGILKQMLSDYNVYHLSADKINNEKYKNINALVLLNNNSIKDINTSFFLENNVLVFCSSNVSFFEFLKFQNIKYITGQISVKKFFDATKTFFITKKIIFNKIEIFDQKITNSELRLTISLTPIEKKILVVLFENKQITRDYFLEKILMINKNIETKSIESHLTRIRKKLVKINSNIQITVKDDIYYLEFN